jgi:hypothetical protein
VPARWLPQPALPALLEEARTLNALWLKSPWPFQRKDVLETLRAGCESGMALVVENDQTDCGQLAPMQRFKAACRVWRCRSRSPSIPATGCGSASRRKRQRIFWPLQ